MIDVPIIVGVFCVETSTIRVGSCVSLGLMSCPILIQIKQITICRLKRKTPSVVLQHSDGYGLIMN